MSEKLRKVTFEPDSKQVKFVEIYLDYSQKMTKEEMANIIGVTRMTLWRWFRNKDFVNWINSKKDELLNKSLMAIYKTAIRKAIAGDFKFSKMLFEIQGEYTKKSETKVTQVHDEYENMTTEEIIMEFEHELEAYKEIHRTSENKPGRPDKKINKD